MKLKRCNKNSILCFQFYVVLVSRDEELVRKKPNNRIRFNSGKVFVFLGPKDQLNKEKYVIKILFYFLNFLGNQKAYKKQLY